LTIVLVDSFLNIIIITHNDCVNAIVTFIFELCVVSFSFRSKCRKILRLKYYCQMSYVSSGLLSERNPWKLSGSKSRESLCSLVPISCLAYEVRSRQKSMCLAATGRLQGRAAKLLLVHRKSWYSKGLSQFALQLTARW
jgi:hypothetical protein